MRIVDHGVTSLPTTRGPGHGFRIPPARPDPLCTLPLLTIADEDQRPTGPPPSMRFPSSCIILYQKHPSQRVSKPPIRGYPHYISIYRHASSVSEIVCLLPTSLDWIQLLERGTVIAKVLDETPRLLALVLLHAVVVVLTHVDVDSTDRTTRQSFRTATECAPQGNQKLACARKKLCIYIYILFYFNIIIKDVIGHDCI